MDLLPDAASRLGVGGLPHRNAQVLSISACPVGDLLARILEAYHTWLGTYHLLLDAYKRASIDIYGRPSVRSIHYPSHSLD